jgi:WD40 repeat protein
MILALSWAPLAAGIHFATGGRDKAIKIWTVEGDAIDCVQSISTSAPVTALAFLHDLVNEQLILAYGLETGCVEICQVDLNASLSPAVKTYPSTPVLQQSKSVLQLAWRPAWKDQTNGYFSKTADASRQLAIASADGSLHIASINLS